jgi:NAD(P)H-hydrate repair Nnr-like enzyme with NAD(P)H-hydrate dehydratase domain
MSPVFVDLRIKLVVLLLIELSYTGAPYFSAMASARLGAWYMRLYLHVHF